MKKAVAILSMALAICLLFCACKKPESEFHPEEGNTEALTLESIPEFSGEPYVAVNDNEPDFSENDMLLEPFESYSELDSLGRCGVVFACIAKELMPTEEREGIGQIKPSGWVTAKYDFVDGKYLYNRCHLIGFQLTGENANEQNLITGTRYMNVQGMLPFENMVADYIKETNNRVLYRVTPIFKDNELVARGVQMEAYSIEDEGEGICFNVYVYNNQPGVTIDYATGQSRLSEESSGQSTDTSAEAVTYILNTNSKKFHLESCSGAEDIKESNRSEYTGTRDELINKGYEPCKTCNP